MSNEYLSTQHTDDLNTIDSCRENLLSTIHGAFTRIIISYIAIKKPCDQIKREIYCIVKKIVNINRYNTKKSHQIIDDVSLFGQEWYRIRFVQYL